MLSKLSPYHLVVRRLIVRNTFDNAVICEVEVQQEQQMQRKDDATDDQFLRMTTCSGH